MEAFKVMAFFKMDILACVAILILLKLDFIASEGIPLYIYIYNFVTFSVQFHDIALLSCYML